MTLTAGYSKPVDIWARGVITYFLLYGHTPFDRITKEEEIRAIKRGAYKFEPAAYRANVSKTARDFVKKCLTVDPSRRPTVEQLLKHKWLANATSHIVADPAVQPVNLLLSVQKELVTRKTREWAFLFAGITESVIPIPRTPRSSPSRHSRRHDSQAQANERSAASEKTRKKMQTKGEKVCFTVQTPPLQEHLTQSDKVTYKHEDQDVVSIPIHETSPVECLFVQQQSLHLCIHHSRTYLKCKHTTHLKCWDQHISHLNRTDKTKPHTCASGCGRECPENASFDVSGVLDHPAQKPPSPVGYHQHAL
jgi:serine/threonine protein kinase